MKPSSKNKCSRLINHCPLLKNLIFILLLGSGIACAHTASTTCNYNQFFRGQWDDFYKRALCCIENENFQQALEDFQSSLERRPPSKQFDRRMVRTYGMHYLDYFPHREMGFVYYLKDKYEKALKYLNHSIHSEPSAKAYYYLKQTKKKMQDAFQSNAALPELTIIEPDVINKTPDEIWQSETPFIIKGKACEKEWISSILIQGKPLWIDHAAPCVEFNKTLYFQEGRHTIRLEAQNIHGDSVEKRLILNVDQTGPVLSCKKSNEPNMINIQAKDHSGQISLWINHQPITSTENFLLNWEISWPESNSELYICAQDKCNNETCATISYDSIFSSPQLSGLIVENNLLIQTDARSSHESIKTNQIDIVLNQKDNVFVYSDNIKISGQIKSKRTLSQILINKKPIAIQPSKEIFFSRHIYLRPKDNVISVTATDISGFSMQKQVHVYRKIPSVFQLKYRYGLSMYPFVMHSSKKHNWITKLFDFTQTKEMQSHSYQAEKFEKDFFNCLRNQRRFRVNYRGKAFNDSNDTQVLPSQSTILGDSYTSRFGLEITARIVDNQTSAVLTIKDVYREKKDDINIYGMAEELSEKIHQNFPLIKGEIIAKTEDGFRIKTSASKLPATVWPMIVYQKNSFDTIQGEESIIIGNANIISSPHENNVKMIFVDGCLGERSIQGGDLFIAR
ncbi:secreted protein containing Tetratricopeptide, SHNi-TPR domain protein [Candidatus Magnetomorum sp. HK-1]|nr:secreted protein containing Tetratricopeptide, SHNi-TPR domain protein [Candidatus Magnetomorum sp. HK-1]